MKSEYIRIRSQTLKALKSIAIEEELQISELSDRILTDYVNNYDWGELDEDEIEEDEVEENGTDDDQDTDEVESDDE